MLLVNHGSRSKLWRDMLLDLEKAVKPKLLAHPKISAVRTAFMEYNEPSIATRMKEFDQEGFDDVIVVPIFLTVSFPLLARHSGHPGHQCRPQG